MAFDAFMLGAVSHELNQWLLDAKIMKIYQPDRFSISLFFHNHLKGDRQLFISAHPVDARIHLSDKRRDNPQTPPLFCMVLRKHLEKARVKAIRQRGWDRILEIDFSGLNDWGEETFCRLVIEIMGKHSNIVLVNQNGVILDGIRRYSHFVSRHREILPGKIYISPPAQDKKELFLFSEDSLASLFFSLPYDMRIKDALLKEGAGISPLLSDEVIERASLDHNIIIEELGHYEISRLLLALKEIHTIYFEKSFDPVVLGKDYPLDIAAFSLKLWLNQPYLKYESPSSALDDFYTLKNNHGLFISRQREMLKIVENHCHRLEKKIALENNDLEKAQKSEFYKEAADLLSASLYSLKKGMDKAFVENFYRPGEILEIPLDPALSPEENMKIYYRRYTKGKNALSLILKQLEANQEEADYAETLLVSLRNAKEQQELEEIREELEAAGYLKENRQNKDKKHNKVAPLAPRTFISSDGYTILVGRNNKQNDTLTLKLANKNDIWLHTQKIPGSHVIVKSMDGTVSDTAIAEAASLAAWYSKAQSADKVPVDYTTVDQVKKPNGAKPGMVIYFQQKTLYVKPQESIIKNRAD